MATYLRIIILSIVVLLIGLYFPILILVVVNFDGDTTYEALLPYCIISSIIFLAVYLWFERKNITKSSTRTRKKTRAG